MPTHVLTIGFVIWVAYQTFRGFRKGFWVALLGILALVVAYLVAFYFGQNVVQWLSGLAQRGLLPMWFGQYASVIAYPIMYLVVIFIVRNVPLLLFPVMGKSSTLNAPAGAAVGAVSGVISGLFIVWFVALLADLSSNTPASDTQITSASKSAPVSDFDIRPIAASFVAKTAVLGVKATGGGAQTAAVIDAVIRKPQATFLGLQGLAKSREFKVLMNDPRTQSMMATNDVGSLMSSESFLRLMQLPEMDSLLAQTRMDGKTKVQATQFFAEQLTFVWRRMQAIKHDPRVQEILSSPEFREAANGGSSASLMTNPKFQRLVAIVLEGRADPEDVDYTQFVDGDSIRTEPELTDVTGDGIALEPEPYVPEPVYKWRDDNGRIQYSDFDAIPKDKLNAAQRMLR